MVKNNKWQNKNLVSGFNKMGNDSAIQSIEKTIDDLNKRAWDVRVFDSPKAFTLCKESLKLARSIGYLKGIAEGTRSLGFCYVRLGKNEEARPLLQESLALFQSLNDLQGQAVVYQYLGVMHRNWGDFGPALAFLFQALELSRQTAFRENEGSDHYQIGVTYKYLGNFDKALEYLFNSLSIYREESNRLFQSYPINVIGSIHFENGDYPKALDYYREGLTIRKESRDKLGEAGSLNNIGYTFLKLKDYAQAIDYCTKSLEISKITDDKRSQANTLSHLAEIYEQTGDFDKAIFFCNESLQIRKAIGDKRGECEILLFLAGLPTNHAESENRKESFRLLEQALKIAEEIKGIDLLSKARFHLYRYYKQEGNFNEAVNNLESHIAFENELHRNTINQKVVNLEISYKAEETKKEAEAIRRKNEELTKLYKEVEAQKKKLEEAIADLKATQAQLIQSEKMASLGELTAGIAHEIQNPLNFVNNFSEVNKELLREMNDGIDTGNLELVKAIAEDAIENEEKINHHGKRAEAIVKGMLQHSRKSTGNKEPTDINALADEYLRLAYHGLRAKDRSFNATLKTNFDQTIDKINIIPQDIGRVILNLITNAFYAVNEKRNKQTDNYEPTVLVSTKKHGDKALIVVTDNGNGIPKNILEKIFQPFFTTKPTGQGTGLGLSLAYDIVKAHGGEVKVETKEGEGSEFVIQLPIA